jgi:WD40 repeat protein
MVRRDRIVIVLEKITYVYMLNSLKPVCAIETINNEKGVAAISYDKDIFIMLTLCTVAGNLRMENFYTGEVKTAQMHENPIYMLAVDFSGHYGASASAQGTIIRVFECSRLEALYELRRGTSPAQISSISFSPQLNYLIVTSNKSTIHLWKLEKKQNYTGMLSKYLPSYLQYHRSLNKITIKPEIEWTCPFTNDIGPKACFINENEFCVAQLDGNLYKCAIEPSTGSMSIKETTQFLDFSDPQEKNKAWINIE